ncbi:DUF2157 domain-containing protein [Litoribrevibacter euphylliae]|uniref:DUF2157 domain-containing protein n=1 Tax=Litoribrevibacter euphylliae TaxID=1834034 RepID=A0ABV7HKC8_9GAMM
MSPQVQKDKERLHLRAHLLEFVEESKIPKHKVDQAIQVSSLRADANTWFQFTDKLLLILGGLALSFALLFFIAYNWQELGRFAKFALIEVAVILGSVAFIARKSKDLVAKIALLCGAMSLGVLMAYYGQTYQTGADAWELFFNWALLITPWVLIARFSVLWLLWLGLFNLSLVLYHQTFGSLFWTLFRANDLLWLLFGFNLLAWCLWEYMQPKLSWLDDDWSRRVVATVTGFCITWLSIDAVIRPFGLTGFWVWLVWCVGVMLFYQYKKKDLYMLAGGCLSAISVILATLIENVFEFDEAGSYLLTSVTMIGLGAGSAMWLRSVHSRWLAEALTEKRAEEKATVGDSQKTQSKQDQSNDGGES